MMSLAASLILYASIVVGGVAYQYWAKPLHAVIYYQDGHIEKVSVRNSGQYFCPFYCRVNHPHLVHDIRWTCADREKCGHFIVLTVIRNGNVQNLSTVYDKPLTKESADPAPTGSIWKIAAWAGSRIP